MTQNNIVVLGAGFAGLGVAHYLLRHTVPAVSASSGDTYKVILVNPSSHAYWTIGAPRALISEKLWPLEKSFKPIAEHFKSYPSEAFEFVQGEAAELDTAAHKLAIRSTVENESEATRTIDYRALVVATGASSPNPLWGLHGTHDATRAALHDIHERLPGAKSIVVAGGGPAGTETAGELASEFGGNKDITLLSGATGLLSAIRPDLGQQAEKYLQQMHVAVKHNARVTSTSSTPRGATLLALSDGTTLTTDLFIDATGLKPNTTWLPATLRDAARGAVPTDPHTLRVAAPGSAAAPVYAVGSVASYSNGGILDVNDALPQLMRTIEFDLSGAKAGFRAEGKYQRNEKELMVVPIGRSKGVGVIFGWKVPSWFVWALKGRDYMSSNFVDTLDGGKYVKKV